MKSLSAVGGFVCICLFGACRSSGDHAGVAYGGRVIREDGHPVPGATVSVNDLVLRGLMHSGVVAELVTDKVGRFSGHAGKQPVEPLLIVKGWSRRRFGTVLPGGSRVVGIGNISYKPMEFRSPIVIVVPEDFQTSAPPQNHVERFMNQLRRAAVQAEARGIDPD